MTRRRRESGPRGRLCSGLRATKRDDGAEFPAMARRRRSPVPRLRLCRAASQGRVPMPDVRSDWRRCPCLQGRGPQVVRARRLSRIASAAERTRAFPGRRTRGSQSLRTSAWTGGVRDAPRWLARRRVVLQPLRQGTVPGQHRRRRAAGRAPMGLPGPVRRRLRPPCATGVPGRRLSQVRGRSSDVEGRTSPSTPADRQPPGSQRQGDAASRRRLLRRQSPPPPSPSSGLLAPSSPQVRGRHRFREPGLLLSRPA